VEGAGLYHRDADPESGFLKRGTLVSGNPQELTEVIDRQRAREIEIPREPRRATGGWDAWQTANGLVNLKAGVR
jgi:hypothetical protein